MVGLVLLAFGHLQDKSIRLAFRPTINKAYRYSVETTNGAGDAATVKLAKTVKATGLTDGVYTVVTTFDSVAFGVGSADTADQAARLIRSTTVNQTVDGTGLIVTSDATRSIAKLMVGGLDVAALVIYSPNPVSVGDTWRARGNIDGVLTAADITLLKLTSDHGKGVADLEMHALAGPGSDPDMPIRIEVDVDSGTLRRLEASSSPDARRRTHVLITLR